MSTSYKSGGFTRFKQVVKSALIVLVLIGMVAVLLFLIFKRSSDKEDESAVERPIEIVNNIFKLADEKEYADLASYCRSFMEYSVELYFTDNGGEITEEQEKRYSEVLYKLYKNYVTVNDLTEKTDEKTRTGSVTGRFTSVDLEKLSRYTDSEINKGLKKNFDAQMDYLESVIGDPQFKSKEFTVNIDFDFIDKEWKLVDRNFLLLLTLGYYSK